VRVLVVRVNVDAGGAAHAGAADGEDAKSAEDASRERGFLLRDQSILSEFVFREYVRDFAADMVGIPDAQLLTFLLETFGFRAEDHDDVHAVFYRQRERDVRLSFVTIRFFFLFPIRIFRNFSSKVFAMVVMFFSNSVYIA
jgi:hypothetical protein